MSFARRILTKGVALVFVSAVAGCAHQLPKETTTIINEQMNSYTAHRGLNLNASKISEQLTVNGPFVASNADLNDVFLNGKSEINNSRINGTFDSNGALSLNHVNFAGDVSLNGRLEAKYTAFNGNISANSEYIELVKTQVKKIHVRAGRNPVVKLVDGSIVAGDIVFESGKGKVIIDKESRVLGSVYSGMAQSEIIQINLTD